MTTNECKKIMARELAARGLGCTKLTARTIDFSDLARAQCVFVKLDTSIVSPTRETWSELRAVAVSNGFRIE